MNILFVIPTYKPAYIYGGPVVTVSMLAEQLVKLGHQVTVYTTTGNGDIELDVEIGKGTLVDGVKVIYFKRLTKGHTHISTALWKHLSKTIKQFDAVHIHSWWNIAILGVAWVCKRKSVKPILSPHGMFSSYILNNRNRIKKKIINQAIGKRLLKNTYLHVSTQMEWEESLKINPEWEGKVIPNLVMLPENKYEKQENDVLTIGFISRIHPKKGLDILIKALGKVDFPYILRIAGTGETEYVDSLKELAQKCGNEKKIEWVGWKDGEAKFKFLSEIDLFALTSHSENFAIVVIEALSVGTPVLISNQVGLCKYVEQNNCGWICDLDVANITKQLNNIHQSKNTLKKIKTIAPLLIQKDYDEVSLTNQYVQFLSHSVK